MFPNTSEVSQMVFSMLKLRSLFVAAPNDSFLLNTLKTLFLGELESFRYYKGLSIIFPKNFDAIGRITKVRHFLIPLSITFLNPKI